MDEEQRDHRLTSHVNLIDLAGSECCSTAQTTGERLKVNHNLISVDVGRGKMFFTEHL